MRPTSGFEWSYRDLLFALFIAVFAMAALMSTTHQKKAEAGVQAGLLSFYLDWNKKADADIDLWIQGPDDEPVGFSRKNGKHCNLLRDDLGRSQDPESHNYENTVCRSALPGEYAVNCMAYNVRPNQDTEMWPVTCRVKVSRLKDGDSLTLVEGKEDLEKQHQEVTVMRFSIDEQGNLVPGSVNKLHKPLFYYRSNTGFVEPPQ